MKLFKNDANGALVEIIESPEEDIVLEMNGVKMRELKPGESDGAGEKHVPAVKVEDGKLFVQIGDVVHPMLEEHYITNIWAEYPDGTVEKVALKPGEKPTAVFDVTDVNGKMKVYEYCNIHGLWVKELEI